MVLLKDLKKYPCKSKGFIWTRVVIPGTKEYKRFQESMEGDFFEQYRRNKGDPQYYEKDNVHLLWYRKKLHAYASGKKHVLSLLNNKNFKLIYANTHRGRIVHVNGILTTSYFSLETNDPIEFKHQLTK